MLQLKNCSKSSLSSSYLNSFPFLVSFFCTSSTIFLETSFPYRFCHFIFLFPIAHSIISAIRLEFIGGAIMLVHASIVSVLSDQNLTVTQGVSTMFASSCILPESVTTAHATLIISITSAWWARAAQYAKFFLYFSLKYSMSSLSQYLSIADSDAYSHRKHTYTHDSISFLIA